MKAALFIPKIENLKNLFCSECAQGCVVARIAKELHRNLASQYFQYVKGNMYEHNSAFMPSLRFSHLC